MDVSARDGLISLREAIVATSNNAANFDAPAGDANGDQIVFSPNLAGQTITLNSRLFDITDDLLIRGNNITIDAAQNQRIFSVASSELVGLSNIRLTGGRSEEGGAIRFSGSGTLRLTDVELFENSNAALRGPDPNIFYENA